MSARSEQVAEPPLTQWFGYGGSSWPRIVVLTLLCAAALFFLHGYDGLLPYALPPLLVGACVGLSAGRRFEAAVAGFAGAVLGSVAAMAWYSSDAFTRAVNSMPAYANVDVAGSLYVYFLSPIVAKSPTMLASLQGHSPVPVLSLACLLVPLAAVSAASLSGAASWAKLARMALAWTVVALVAASWLFSVWAATNDLVPFVRQEPVNGAYANDQGLNLKVFYLMHQGEGFYRAYVDAHAADERHLYPVRDGKFIRGTSTMMREPAMFYLWKFVAPNGDFANVLYLALAGGIAVMFGSFWALSAVIGYRALFVGPALFPGLLLLASDMNPFFPEFWALIALLAAFFALVRGKAVTAGVLGLVAVLFRETFGVWLLALVLAALVLSLADRRNLKDAAVFVGLLGTGVVAYLLHVAAGSAHYASSQNSILATYLLASAARPFQLRLLAPLSYMMFPYGFFRFPAAWFVPFGLVGLWVGLRRAPMARLTSTLYAVLLVGYFAFFGAPSQYWGQAVMPLMLVGCVLFLASIDQLGKKASWTLPLRAADTGAAAIAGVSAGEG